jgi:hypothetical protein
MICLDCVLKSNTQRSATGIAAFGGAALCPAHLVITGTHRLPGTGSMLAAASVTRTCQLSRLTCWEAVGGPAEDPPSGEVESVRRSVPHRRRESRGGPS